MLSNVLDIGEMSPLVVTFPHGLLNAIEEPACDKGNPNKKKQPVWRCFGHLIPVLLPT